MKVVSLDPGTTTGVAIYDGKRDDWDRYQLGPKEHHDQLYDVLESVKPLYVVCETFTFQPRTKVVLDSVEYIGVMKLWCQHNDRRPTMQTPAQGKAFWGESKLRAVGLWLANQPHAMDATRHLLYWWMSHQDRRFVERLAGTRGGA